MPLIVYAFQFQDVDFFVFSLGIQIFLAVDGLCLRC